LLQRRERRVRNAGRRRGAKRHHNTAAWQAESESRIISSLCGCRGRIQENSCPAINTSTFPPAAPKIAVNSDYSLKVPDQPIIPYIEGDGTGVDITPVMIKVVDAAVAKAYGGKRRIQWMEIFAGEKSTKIYGADVWLPDETLTILKDYVVSIKGR
jgi:hypothetical protein